MAKSGKEELGQIVIRPPAGMRERIKALAEGLGRSMNAEIVEALEEHLRRAEMQSQGWAWVPPSLQIPSELVTRLDEVAQERRSTVQAEVAEAIVAHLNRIDPDDDQRRRELERLVGEIVDLVRYDLEAKARDGG
jgi:predicted DNA-binding protein